MLSLLNDIPVVPDTRSKLYYNKYMYRVRVVMDRIGHLRYTSSITSLHESLSRSNGWATYGITMEPLPHKNIELLEKLMHWKNANSSLVLVRYETHSCSIFFNDMGIVNSLTALDESLVSTVSQAHAVEDPEVIYLKAPKHKYRIYFKACTVTNEYKEDLKNLLSVGSKTFYPCGALVTWLHIKSVSVYHSWFAKHLMEHYFIEYDDESMLTMLKLQISSGLGKIYKLEQRA